MEIRSLAAHLLCGPVPSRPRDWCWCWRTAQGLGTPCLNSAVSDGLAGCSVTAAGPRAAREAAVGRCLSSVLLGETSRPHSAHLPGNERHWGASHGRRSGSEGWPASRGAPLAARPLVKPSVASVKTGPMLTWTSVVRPTHPPQRRAGRAAGLSIILSCWFNLRLCRSSFTLQFGIFVTVRHLPVKLLAVMTIIRRLRSASELGRRVRVRIVLRDSAAQTRLRARQPRLPSLPGPAGRGKALACAEHPARRLVQRVGAYPPQPCRPPSSSHRHGKLKAEHTASAGSFSVKVLGAQTAGRRMPLESAVSGGGVFASQVVRGRRRDVFPRGRCPAALLSRCVEPATRPAAPASGSAEGGSWAEQRRRTRTGCWGRGSAPRAQPGLHWGRPDGATQQAPLEPRVCRPEGTHSACRSPRERAGQGWAGRALRHRGRSLGPESGALRCADGAAGRPDEWLPHRGHFLWDPGAGTAFFGETCSKFQCKSQSLKHSRGRQRGGRITHGTLVYLRDFSCQLVTRRTVHFRPWKRCADSQERKGVA